MTQPIYTPDNCHPAYQLRWSLALFAEAELPPVANWLDPLKAAVERDGVRLLEHHFKPPNVRFFLLSTQPAVAPPEIVKSVKGRLQHAVRDHAPRAFRRNFFLTSVGDARRDVVENYVAEQLGHHRMADERVQQALAEFQLSFPHVDLAMPERSAHGEYVYNLHLVLVNQGRWCEIRPDRLAATRDMILASAGKKGHRLSRVSLFADHLHITLGCPYDQAPQELALGYLNNLAYANGMTDVFAFGYYVGTFGEYDMGAIWGARSLPP